MSYQGPPSWNPNPPPQQWAPQTFQPQQWQQPPAPRPKSGLGLIAGAAALAVALMVGGWLAYRSRFDHGTSAEAIAAFRTAGLEVGEMGSSTRGFLDTTPQTERDGLAFEMPSAGLFARGRVWSFVNQDALQTKRNALSSDGHWLLIRHNFLLDLPGRVPEDRATRYGDALEGL
ncbi:MAG: hypothetical protein JWM10_1935 [Myxococcaceae bacterium]|nr:hypothetical protein [Myxococcaceae bacterium]